MKSIKNKFGFPNKVNLIDFLVCETIICYILPTIELLHLTVIFYQANDVVRFLYTLRLLSTKLFEVTVVSVNISDQYDVTI